MDTPRSVLHGLLLQIRVHPAGPSLTARWISSISLLSLYLNVLWPFQIIPALDCLQQCSPNSRQAIFRPMTQVSHITTCSEHRWGLPLPCCLATGDAVARGTEIGWHHRLPGPPLLKWYVVRLSDHIHINLWWLTPAAVAPKTDQQLASCESSTNATQQRIVRSSLSFHPPCSQINLVWTDVWMFS